MHPNEIRASFLRYFARHAHRIVPSSPLVPADDPTRRRPDITLAKTRLGWQPKVPLREGLKRTIEWFKSIDLGDYRPPTPNV